MSQKGTKTAKQEEPAGGPGNGHVEWVDEHEATSAQGPERPPAEVPERRKVITHVGDFGGCPECGQSTRFVSLLGDGWLVCRDHRTRWCIGNIFDTYDWEWKAWRTIERYLSFFREVDPLSENRGEE